MTARQANITLGTAGHIDHGKTALIKLLTGCETDRLKEEIERGMSIELGFAPCLIADLEVGIVDVPGHEHFIKTMVAGATGMDGVIFVVAADDGIMPQTREHLDILTLLGIGHGIVALTKIDRVGTDRVAQVREDLERFLRGTFLEAAPILPLSNITGEGLDAFLKALQALVQSIQPKTVDGVFRLNVEKTFSIKGTGTVITGIPVAGAARLGDEVVLVPQDLTGRITGLQVYGRAAETAMAGQCTAVNIRHWEAGSIRRGDTLTRAGFFEPAEWYVCQLRLLPHETFVLKNAAKVKFHTGTSEVPASVYLLEGDLVRPPAECLIQVKCEQPLVAGPGDRFILRTPSPPMTVGGGIVVEPTPRRLKRNQPGLYEDLQERAAAVRSDATFAEYCLRTAETVGVGQDDLAHRVKTPVARLPKILADLCAAGQAVVLAPGLYAHRDQVAAAEGRVLAALKDFHEQSPESPGLDAEALLAAAAPLSKTVVECLLARLTKAGKVADRGGRIALAEHRAQVADKDREVMDRVEATLRNGGFSPPRPGEVAAAAGLGAAEAARILRLLVERGQLVQVAPDLLFHREAVDRAQQILVDHIRQEGPLESVKFKYLLETTRKFAIPLLDYFDRVGVTRPVGHTRYLRAEHRQG